MCEGQRTTSSIGHHPTSFIKHISIYLLFVSLFNDMYDDQLDCKLPRLFCPFLPDPFWIAGNASTVLLH